MSKLIDDILGDSQLPQSRSSLNGNALSFDGITTYLKIVDFGEPFNVLDEVTVFVVAKDITNKRSMFLDSRFPTGTELQFNDGVNMSVSSHQNFNFQYNNAVNSGRLTTSWTKSKIGATEWGHGTYLFTRSNADPNGLGSCSINSFNNDDHFPEGHPSGISTIPNRHGYVGRAVGGQLSSMVMKKFQIYLGSLSASQMREAHNKADLNLVSGVSSLLYDLDLTQVVPNGLSTTGLSIVNLGTAPNIIELFGTGNIINYYTA